MERDVRPKSARRLPDWFVAVAEDVLSYCRPEEGVWVDLGCGSGGLGLALARASRSTILLVDPRANALRKALESAKHSGLGTRALAVAGRAESMPFADCSVNLVVSRGSVFFWDEPAQGLREVYRILGPGGRALVGGGFGSSYPESARQEFFRRRNQELKARSEKALDDWYSKRRPEWLELQARAAGLGESLLEPVPPGFWLLFEKGGVESAQRH